MSTADDLLWGIDLGGTKVEGVVIQPGKQPQVLVRKRIASESSGGYSHIIGRIEALINDMAWEVKARPEIIGIGTPGTLDPHLGVMKNSNSTSLNGQPLKRDLQDLLDIPVRMANDANCFALAEARMGIVPELMPDANVVFGVIMGTGVGGGVVVNNKVINGRQGIAGEWGHNFLDNSGGKCYCGKWGCVETVLAGPSLERFYHGESGKKAKLSDILASHKSGKDPAADKTVERLIHFFGLGLSNVINILDPDIIVIGGGVGNIALLYEAGPGAIKQFVFDTGKGFHTVVAKPKLGDSAGVFGAAFLVEGE